MREKRLEMSPQMLPAVCLETASISPFQNKVLYLDVRIAEVIHISLFVVFILPLCFIFELRGLTWEKFSSLPAKKPQKFETATGKENF